MRPLCSGQQHVADLVSAVQNSPYWQGHGDHHHLRRARRPLGPRRAAGGRQWGPGTRVPAIIISPFAKKGFVDHTQYDTTSILKFIETRWGLAPLGDRDAAANDLTNAFNFSAQSVPAAPSAPGAPSAPNTGTLSGPGFYIRRLGDG